MKVGKFPKSRGSIAALGSLGLASSLLIPGATPIAFAAGPSDDSTTALWSLENLDQAHICQPAPATSPTTSEDATPEPPSESSPPAGVEPTPEPDSKEELEEGSSASPASGEEMPPSTKTAAPADEGTSEGETDLGTLTNRAGEAPLNDAASASPTDAATNEPEASPDEENNPPASSEPTTAPNPSPDPSPSAGSPTPAPSPREPEIPTAAPSSTESPEPADTATASPSASESPTSQDLVSCPDTPTGLRVLAKASGADVYWDFVAQAEDTPAPVIGYVVRVAPSDQVLVVDASQQTAAVTELKNGETYTVTVQAVNKFGASQATAAIPVTPSLDANGEISGLIVSYREGVEPLSSEEGVTGSQSVDLIKLLPGEDLGLGMRSVRLPEEVSATTAQDVAQDLASDPRVEWAQPDFRVFRQSEPELPKTPVEKPESMARQPGLLQSVEKAKSPLRQTLISDVRGQTICDQPTSVEPIARCYSDSDSDAGSSLDAEIIWSNAYVRSTNKSRLIFDIIPFVHITDSNWLLYDDVFLGVYLDTDGDGWTEQFVFPQWAALGENQSTGVRVYDFATESIRSCSGTWTRRHADHRALLGSDNSWWQLNADWACITDNDSSRVQALGFAEDYLAFDYSPDFYSSWSPMDFGTLSDSSPTVPSSPRAVSVTPINQGLGVGWTVPSSSGGSAITSYTARAYSAITGGSLQGSCTTPSQSCTIQGLNNGETFYIDVTATNGVGQSLPSSPRVAGIPREPSLVSVNDPYFTNRTLWGLNGSYGIRAPEAWEQTMGSSSTVVAVLDTGSISHPDLTGQTVAGYDMISNSTAAGDGNGRDSNPADTGDFYGGAPSSWHGAHVAGTINAIANNSIGVVGVAPDVKVQHVRVLGRGGGLTSDVVSGIIWAAGGTVSGLPTNSTPANVINMSLGGVGTCSTAEQEAIDFAVSRGTTVVVAAGNSNANASGFSPASCRNVIAVAATDSSGRRASFSNYGSTVDVAAPGVNIMSTVDSGTTIPRSASYASYDGTSMASPHVAGAAALLVSQHPSLTPSQLESRLKDAANLTTFPGGACDSSSWKSCGSGIVDASKLVATEAPDVPVTSVMLSPSSANLTTGQVVQITSTVLPDNASDSSLLWESSNSSVASVDSNGYVSAVAPGSTTITAVSVSTPSVMANVSVVVARPVTVPDAPSISSITPGDGQVEVVWGLGDDGGESVRWAQVMAFSAQTGGSVESVCTYRDPTSGGTCELTGLTNGTTYWVTAHARNTRGWSTQATRQQVTPVAPKIDLSAPEHDQSSFAITPSAPDRGDEVTVRYSITDDVGCCGFNIVYLHQPDGIKVDQATGVRVSGTATDGTYEATVTVPADGSPGTWTIRNQVTDLVGRYSNLAVLSTFSTPSTPPAQPIALEATPGNGQVQVSWALSDDRLHEVIETQALVYSTEVGGSPLQTCSDLSPSLSGNTCTADGLSNGSTYWVTARARNAFGWSTAIPREVVVLPRRSQTVVFEVPTEMDTTEEPEALNARATSGLPIILEVTTPLICELEGARLNALSAGTCMIEASQPGNAEFLPADVVRRSTQVYEHDVISSSRTFVVPSGVDTLQVLLVGAGGGGGAADTHRNSSGGGGGGGMVLEDELSVEGAQRISASLGLRLDTSFGELTAFKGRPGFNGGMYGGNGGRGYTGTQEVAGLPGSQCACSGGDGGGVAIESAITGRPTLYGGAGSAGSGYERGADGSGTYGAGAGGGAGWLEGGEAGFREGGAGVVIVRWTKFS